MLLLRYFDPMILVRCTHERLSSALNSNVSALARGKSQNQTRAATKTKVSTVFLHVHNHESFSCNHAVSRKPLKYFQRMHTSCVRAPLQRSVLTLLTALGGQLAVEFWELCFHRNADGTSQEMDPAGCRPPLLHKTQQTDLLRRTEGEMQGR